jgi:hypothetical protein
MSVAVIGVVAPGLVSELLLCPSATNGPSQLTNPRTRPALIQNLKPEITNLTSTKRRDTTSPKSAATCRRETKTDEDRRRPLKTVEGSPHPVRPRPTKGHGQTPPPPSLSTRNFRAFSAVKNTTSYRLVTKHILPHSNVTDTIHCAGRWETF